MPPQPQQSSPTEPPSTTPPTPPQAGEASGDILVSGGQVTKLANDPQFLTLPPESRKRVLSAIDPMFGKLDDAGIERVVSSLQTKEVRAKTPHHPSLFTRAMEGLGLPSSFEEFRQQSEAAQKERMAHPIKSALIESDPAITAGRMAYDYGKGVVSQFKESAKEGMEAGKNIGEGGPVWANIGKMAAADADYILKGVLAPLGGKAVATSGEDIARHDYWSAAGGVLAASVLSVLGLEGVKKPESALATGSKGIRETERLASIMGPTSGRFDSVAVADSTKPLLKQALSEMGITDKELSPGSKGAFPGRRGLPAKNVPAVSPVTGEATEISNIRAGARRVLDVADHAVDIANRPFEKIVSEYGNEPVGTSGKEIANVLRKKAEEYAATNDTALASALESHAKLVEGAKTIRELNELKIRANKNWQTFKTPGQLEAATVQSGIAWKLTGDSIRAFMYPELERLSGMDLAQYGRREAAAMQFRDGLYKTYYTVVDPSQASEAAKGYLGGLEEGSMYRWHLLKKGARILRTPAGEFNVQFRKGVGKLGEGALPETVETIPSHQRALPAGEGGRPRFQIPMGIPREVVEGPAVTRPAMSYAGQEAIPVPSHTPMPPTGRTTTIEGEGAMEPLSEAEIRGGGVGATKPSLGDTLKTLQSTVDNLQRKLDEGIGDRFQTLAQLRDAQSKLDDAYRGEMSKTESVGGGESANFAKAKAELFPGKRELSTKEVAQVTKRAKELGKAGRESKSVQGEYRGPQEAQDLAARSHLRAEDVAHRPPERSVTGPMSSPEQRMAELGTTASTVPERSFTGPATQTRSRWQFLTSSSEPTESVRIEGPGVLETNDPEAAAHALRGMQNYAKTDAFRQLPFVARERIRNAIADLSGQLKDYAVNQMKKPPRRVVVTPGKAGTLPRTKQRMRAAAAAALQARKQGENKEGDGKGEGEAAPSQ